MFWKKKEEEKQASEAQPAAEKPCCSSKKKSEESEQTDAPTPQQQQQQPAGLSTFEFGGNVAAGLKLVGHCQGTDPDSIQACQWRPSADAKHTILF
ncbi:hypothetical protein Ndes2526A_g07622 [Nannochloris sp. 'desiccata']|nr:hypothetical protein KSW81_002385 [Chlorella desiccata (nom. nud.)]